MKRNSKVYLAVLTVLAVFVAASWVHLRSVKRADDRMRAWFEQSEATAQAAAQTETQADLLHALVGKAAPAFTLEDLNGKKLSLADYQGKAVLINFWATWCGPCKIETPWLIELRNQYAGQGFEILGVSADDIDRDDPTHFAKEKKEIARAVEQMKIPYPVLIDGSTLSKPYGGLDSLPASFFVDRHGKVVATQLGITSKDEIEANVRKALQ